MAQIDRRRTDDAHGTNPGDPDAPTCPKCGSAKATVIGTVAGRVLLRCDACGFNFSVDADAGS